jgi:hypothetical protein
LSMNAPRCSMTVMTFQPVKTAPPQSSEKIDFLRRRAGPAWDGCSYRSCQCFGHNPG